MKTKKRQVCQWNSLQFLCYSLPRKIEDKLDSRGLESQWLTLSMEPPPSAKRVAMQMFAWLCWTDGSFNENIFGDCQLLLDRPGVWECSFVYLRPFLDDDNNSIFVLHLIPPTQTIISQLSSSRRTARTPIPWQPESQYIVPAAAKDALPHASEGNRRDQTD